MSNGTRNPVVQSQETFRKKPVSSVTAKTEDPGERVELSGIMWDGNPYLAPGGRIRTLRRPAMADAMRFLTTGSEDAPGIWITSSIDGYAVTCEKMKNRAKGTVIAGKLYKSEGHEKEPMNRYCDFPGTTRTEQRKTEDYRRRKAAEDHK